MNPNINFYGIVILLRKLRECGIFTEKELRKIAARIAADNGVEVMFFSDSLHLSVAIRALLW